jgi:hypothetical protein
VFFSSVRALLEHDRFVQGRLPEREAKESREEAGQKPSEQSASQVGERQAASS